ARRHAEHARHPHGIPARRHSVLAQRGSHLRQLDEERRGRGDGRSSRPAGATRRRRVEVLELVASLAWAGRGLQSERSEEHRRQRPLLLLRREVIFPSDEQEGIGLPTGGRPRRGRAAARAAARRRAHELFDQTRYTAARCFGAFASSAAAALATVVPSKKRGFWVPHRRTVLPNTKSRKLSLVMCPSSTSSYASGSGLRMSMTSKWPMSEL